MIAIRRDRFTDHQIIAGIKLVEAGRTIKLKMAKWFAIIARISRVMSAFCHISAGNSTISMIRIPKALPSFAPPEISVESKKASPYLLLNIIRKDK